MSTSASGIDMKPRWRGPTPWATDLQEMLREKSKEKPKEGKYGLDARMQQVQHPWGTSLVHVDILDIYRWELLRYELGDRAALWLVSEMVHWCGVRIAQEHWAHLPVGKKALEYQMGLWPSS